MKTKDDIIDALSKYSWYRQACNSKAYYVIKAWFAGIDAINSQLSVVVLNNKLFLEGVYDEKAMIGRAKEVIAEQKADKKWIDNYQKECNKRLGKLDKIYQEYKDFDFNKADYHKIRKSLMLIDSLWYDYWSYMYICDYFDPTGEELLLKEISDTGTSINAEDLDILLKFNKLSYLQEEAKLETVIALDIKNKNLSFDDKSIKKRLEQLAEKYYYIENSWETTRVLTPSDFKRRIERIISNFSIIELQNQYQILKKDWANDQKEIVEKYKISDSLLNVVYLYRRLFFLRDQRKEYVMLINYLFDRFFLRMSEIFNINFSDMNVILIDDLNENLTEQKLRDIIKQRTECMTIASVGKKRLIFTGQEAKDISAKMQALLYSVDKEITGKCACKGKIRGTARIIIGETHFSNFKSGEILIASKTAPEYYPLIKNALGIITDEGGITSHAAIVSRELNKPCIIGTKIATKAINDGDQIELDADNGTIKIL